MGVGKTKVIEEEIEICGYCKGKGKIENKILENKWDGAYKYKYDDCHNCRTTGRMRKITTMEWFTYGEPE